MSISFLYNNTEDLALSALKSLNLKKRLVKGLAYSGENTIPNLSKETGYSIPTVTKIVGDLLEEHIIQDCGKIDTSGGRRPSVYGINPDAFYYLGVEVKRRAVNIGLQGADNKNIKTVENIPFLLENTQEALSCLCDIINIFIDDSGIDRIKIVGACVNLTGRINKDGFSFSYFCFGETPLSAVIGSKIRIRTYIENDTRAMTYGEYNDGVVKNEQDVLFINISWGIGLGIVAGGRLYYGKSGYSGEFGHTPVFGNDIICQCGKKGCLETEVSGWALERNIREKLTNGATSVLTSLKETEGITLEDIICAVREHEDVLVIEAIEEIGEKLGRYLALLVNIFNPELMIIGGTLAAVSDYMQLPMQTAIKRHSLNIVNQDVKFKTSALGSKAGIVGACYIVRDYFFNVM
ncbi:MAG: ROK family protein [Bacteroidales bacterium]|jgi:predicted NBD/HSP70 family sugar kinase|nr:ROK family protein [Bacteroidales bacterium]